jgi:DNA invertase Pin-like site-specific DNA recombinase
VQDGDLVAQHEELNILGGGRAVDQQDQPEHLQEDQVQQPQRHHGIMSDRRSPLVSAPGPTSGTPHPEAQVDALTEAGCVRVFVDKASGKLARRPELDKALDFLRSGDTLVITKLDRLGRSVHNLVELAALLAQRGIDLRVLHQGIDTSTPGGKLTFHILSAIAEFERDLISERTLDGLEAARARGRKGGRPSKVTPAKLATARKLYDAKEHTMAEIAEIVGVPRSTLYKHLSDDKAAMA